MGISLRGIAFTYLAGTALAAEVLSCVDLDLREGEILCLAGASGAGKSTLVQVMGGLLRASRGELALDGRRVTGRGGERALRGAVGVLLQACDKQLFARSVGEDVSFGPRNRGHGAEEAARLASEALLCVGLDPHAYAPRSPFSLSGGEMRRVALAGVLAMRPRFLLLDEPSSGLDAAGREQLHRILREQRERGTGVLVATHDWEEMEALADRVAVLSRGRAALQGETQAVLTAVEDLRAAGLQPPPLVELLAELRLRGLQVPPYLPSPEEAAALIRAALGGGRS